MALVAGALVRVLVAMFWAKPYTGPLVRWGTELHDRFLLPWWLASDIRSVAMDLDRHGYQFDPSWLEPFHEFRFPRLGSFHVGDMSVELRMAIEPWNVLGEDLALRRLAVRRFIRRAASGARRRPDRGSVRDHVQRLEGAVDRHGHTRDLYRGGPLQGVATEVVAAPHDRRAQPARVRRRRPRERPLDRRLQLPREPPWRAVRRSLPAPTPRGGGSPGESLQRRGTHPGRIEIAEGRRDGEYPRTLDLRRRRRPFRTRRPRRAPITAGYDEMVDPAGDPREHWTARGGGVPKLGPGAPAPEEEVARLIDRTVLSTTPTRMLSPRNGGCRSGADLLSSHEWETIEPAHRACGAADPTRTT